jgi:hypothetical protein
MRAAHSPQNHEVTSAPDGDLWRQQFWLAPHDPKSLGGDRQVERKSAAG